MKEKRKFKRKNPYKGECSASGEKEIAMQKGRGHDHKYPKKRSSKKGDRGTRIVLERQLFK